jgi:hypothetical protein
MVGTIGADAAVTNDKNSLTSSMVGGLKKKIESLKAGLDHDHVFLTYGNLSSMFRNILNKI